MKTCIIAVLLVANSMAQAHAQDAICKPLGKLAVYAARERESGKTIEQTYLKMVNEGRIKTTGDTAEWAANTVAWAYEERISSKGAENTRVQKCRRAFSKKPWPAEKRMLINTTKITLSFSSGHFSPSRLRPGSLKNTAHT